MTTFYNHTPDNLSDWQPKAVPEQTRVHTGAVQFNMHPGNEVVQNSVARYQMSIGGTPGGSVANTLNSTFGAPSVELEPGNPTTRTTVETAIRMGLIKRQSDGTLMDAANQQDAIKEALSEPKEAPQVDPGAGVFNPTEDHAFGKMIQPLPQHAYDGALASMVATVAHGHGSAEDTARALAEGARIEVSEATQLIEATGAYFTRVVDRSLAPLGLSGDRLQQAYAFMREKHPAKLQDAIQQLTHGRDASGFKALAVAFKVANPGPVAALQKHGYETYLDRDTGDLMARKGGGQWINATKSMNS